VPAVVNSLVSVKQTKLYPGAAYAALIFLYNQYIALVMNGEEHD